ncbi:hypothetical protein [Paraburkholderia sp. J11-2]|uniref:hypothetical protein n=1 Tax=Paraburkholderia sp. J11-2 TaxID=2805431 RepID=UPI002AB6EF33|nr:hypothetical protein [Paraburkholderia sp. J11-2]
MKTLPEPTQLVMGMSHKEMLEIMRSNDIFCGHDKFTRILQDAQRRALQYRDSQSALDRMTENAEDLGLYLTQEVPSGND